MTQDRTWLDLSSALAAAAASELRAESAELLAAEAARCRLVDRRGPAVLRVAGGAVVAGTLVPSSIDGWLAVDGGAGSVRLVNTAALTLIEGSQAGIRPEDAIVPRTLGSWLREQADRGAVLRVTLTDGRVIVGLPVLVGADHVEVRSAGARVVVPWAAVAWWDTTC